MKTPAEIAKVLGILGDVISPSNRSRISPTEQAAALWSAAALCWAIADNGSPAFDDWIEELRGILAAGNLRRRRGK